ncbi:MAG: hypothetical protein AB1921_03400 [Thermodesulfobacteriota bacterium]
MRCPNCGFETKEEAPDCPRCGVVIGKFYAKRAQESLPRVSQTLASPAPRRGPLPRALFICLCCFVLLWLLSLVMRDRFPGSYSPLPALQRDPVQIKTDREPFPVTVNGVTYTITPLYTYELWGMVVSYQTSGSLADIYHWQLWKDFLNVKDLCVLWGPNLRTHVARKIKFFSDTWTCFCETDDITAWNRFDKERFSNNHLLSDNKETSRQVARARRWDQVHFTGFLCSYSHNENGGFERGTSITRSDTGQGACETVFLTDFEILKRANSGWRSLFTFSGYGILLTLALLLSLAAWKLSRYFRE